MRAVVGFMRPLVAARMMAGLSQDDVAVRIGVCKNTVSALEGGRKSTRLDTIGRYAQLLGMKMQIVFVEDPHTSSSATEN